MTDVRALYNAVERLAVLGDRGTAERLFHCLEQMLSHINALAAGAGIDEGLSAAREAAQQALEGAEGLA